MIKVLTLLLASGALVMAGCGDDDGDGSGSGSASGSGYGGAAAAGGQDSEKVAADKAPPGTTIKIGDSQYGRALFGPQDGAIYYFDKERGARSECYGACAEAWPPVLTEGEPRADGGVQAPLLGTTKRDDGTTQVTYAGRPLYYYVDDPPGEILCHGVDEFGGLWLAVQPSGDPFT